MKVSLQLATSLDGFIARSDGGFDWCFTDQDYGMGAFLASVDAVIMGRHSYELLLAMGETPKADKRYFVLTHQPLPALHANVSFHAGDAAQLRLLMAAEGVRHAWLFGGGQVCGEFAQAGLIDEVIVAVHPIALGQGMPLFKGLQHDLRLTLSESRTYKTGLVMLHYSVQKSA